MFWINSFDNFFVNFSHILNLVAFQPFFTIKI